MAYYLNADEIFRVGVQIEENGREFYRLAAAEASEPEVRDLCRGLAEWESRHVDLFESMRRSLPASARQGAGFDPDSEEQSYLKAAADSHVFLKDKKVATLLADCRTGRDILELAIGFEKDSVVFYSAMIKVVPAEYGGPSLAALVEEELKHVAMLVREKAKLS
jgi:rubrerythrin